MNTRTQITLDPETQRRARKKAAELGISFAEYVRLTLSRDLAPETKPVLDVSCIFDLGASREPTDIARDKDALVGEAVWQEHQRKTGRLKPIAAGKKRK